MADPKPPQSRYAFTLNASVSADPVGETPMGYRVDIQYQTENSHISTQSLPYFDAWVGDDVSNICSLLTQEPLSGFDPSASTAQTTKVLNELAGETPQDKKANLTALCESQAHPNTEKYRPLRDDEKKAVVRAIRNVRELTKRDAEPSPDLTHALRGWYGLEADLVSGSDWAIVRSDGVAEFTGRVTLRSQDDDGGLIALTVGGPVDFIGQLVPAPPAARARRAIASPSQGFQTVIKAMETGQLQSAAVVIAATFSAAGRAEDWAPKRMKRQADGFWKYQMLTQSQFLATGTTAFSPSRLSPITGVELDFYQLRLN